MLKLLMLITAIIIAALMGVRFDFPQMLLDYRLWVAALVSVILWTIVRAVISAIFKSKGKEEYDQKKEE